MDLKDKLNLLWKFLFLSVFAYGVISVSCCASSCGDKQGCSTKQQCSLDKKCCLDRGASTSGSDWKPAVVGCGSNCKKGCCNKEKAAVVTKCGVNCQKPCCAK